MRATVIVPRTDFKAGTGVIITEEEVPKWQYQREKSPRQDVIRDVQLYGSLKRLH
jgi:hypothetical protein